jgi:hypothetical protein
MNVVSRAVCQAAVVGIVLFLPPTSALPFHRSLVSAQGFSKPECVGFNPYKWSQVQIEACVGPVNWGHDLNPYNPYGQPVFVPVKTQAFANVLVGMPGLDNDYDAYLSLENDTEFNWVQVIIRREIGAEIQAGWALTPGQRKVVKLNELTELAGALPLGVSVRVKWMKEGNAGVAMHRARDFGSMVQAVEGGGAK